MTDRPDPPAHGRAPPKVQNLIDRILAADLDPVQIASMELHLSHVLRLRKDGVALQDVPRSAALQQGLSKDATARA